MIVDCVSDLHGFYPKLEGGDLLIIAGDLTARDTFEEHCDFKRWLAKLPYTKKIVIGGNHDNNLLGLRGDDFFFSTYNINTKEQKSYASYLFDSGCEFEGLKIWGSPWTKTFPGMNPKCKAFTLDMEDQLGEKWALIPDDTDILVTHSPMWGTHDLVVMYLDDFTDQTAQHMGSGLLAEWIANHVNSLKLHVCGHIHEGYGLHDIRQDRAMKGMPDTCVMVNASYVDARYRPVNKPVRVIL